MSKSLLNTQRKDYMTGYTGHVPNQKVVFGLTSGDTGRLLRTKDAMNLFYKGERVENKPFKPERSHSKPRPSWIGGPKELNGQKVPGY